MDTCELCGKERQSVDINMTTDHQELKLWFVCVSCRDKIIEFMKSLKEK